MSSFTCNNRHANSRLRPRAFGAGFALSLMSGVALAGAHQFVFTAYSDATGGADVIAGRYRTALEELQSQAGAMSFDAATINTNRCVAYSMTLQWQAARAACDAAIRAADAQRAVSPAWMSWASPSPDEYLAVAYANRAVMFWMSHDQAAAQRDLAKAQQLSPHADFVARNLTALKVRSAVALAGAPAPTS
jgi:hypothetical protein